MTRGEQGQPVTVICGINAAGQYIPLIFLFARKKVGITLMSAAPTHSIGYATGYGWTNAEMFVLWLKHSRIQQKHPWTSSGNTTPS